MMVKLLRQGVVTAEKCYNTNRIQVVEWLKLGQRLSNTFSVGLRKVHGILGDLYTATFVPVTIIFAATSGFLLPVAETADIADEDLLSFHFLLGYHWSSSVSAIIEGL